MTGRAAATGLGPVASSRWHRAINGTTTLDATGPRSYTATAVGEVSVSWSAYRLDQAKIEHTAEDLQAATARISHRMGWLCQPAAHGHLD
jgi:hypothetical protein